MGNSEKILNNFNKIMLEALPGYSLFIHVQHLINIGKDGLFEVYFPISNFNYIREDMTFHIDYAPFQNSLLAVKQIDPYIINNIRFPEYIEVLDELKFTDYSVYFLEIDEDNYNNTFSFIFEYDFYFL